MLQIKRNPVERFAIPFTSQKIRDYEAQKIENLRGRPDDYVKVAKKKSETIMSKWAVKILINLDSHHHEVATLPSLSKLLVL